MNGKNDARHLSLFKIWLMTLVIVVIFILFFRDPLYILVIIILAIAMSLVALANNVEDHHLDIKTNFQLTKFYLNTAFFLLLTVALIIFLWCLDKFILMKYLEKVIQ